MPDSVPPSSSAAPMPYPAPSRPGGYNRSVALVLQGGGALGSYQAGVYQALAESPYLPDWVAGISVGSINAAIIAGNAPDRRVAQLRAFWEEVTLPTSLWPPPPAAGPLADGTRRTSALAALLFGQPGFFAPRPPLQWLHGKGPTSYYDTGLLRGTLERLVDFDRINAREVRLSVGAVNVRTGIFRYFDSAHMAIRPEHIMASGALPPGFPAVEVDGEPYWDGGLVSNTPLQFVVEYHPRRSRLIFQVDLFHGSGEPPLTLDDVTEREKDIRFASRTRVVTEMVERLHDVRHNLNTLLSALPPELKSSAAARKLHAFACDSEMDIAQLIYRPEAPQGPTKDFEFSRATMLARWAQGAADASATLLAAPWLEPPADDVGARTFDVPHQLSRPRG